MLCTTVPAIVHLALQCSTEPAGQDPARSSARRMWLAWSWYVMICYDLYGKVLVLHGFTWFYMVLPCFTLFYQCSAASICQRSGAKVYGQLLVTILVACQNLVHLDASRNARAQRKSEWILKQYLKHNETHWESFQETSSHGFICCVVARWPITA